MLGLGFSAGIVPSWQGFVSSLDARDGFPTLSVQPPQPPQGKNIPIQLPVSNHLGRASLMWERKHAVHWVMEGGKFL